MSELIDLIRKGRASTFNLELRAALEDTQQLSLEGETFEKMTFEGFDFRQVDFTNVEFDACEFKQVRFERCTLEGTYLQNCVLTDTTWVECTGEGLSIDACTFHGGAFEGGEFEAADWSDLQLLGTEMVRLNLQKPLWERLTFKGGHLHTVKLTEGELTHVTLREFESWSGLVLEECQTTSCYVVTTSDAALPAGFHRKSGRRRAL